MLAGLILVLLTGVLALRPEPRISPESVPVALELPETLAVPPARQAPDFVAGLGLLGLAGLLLLAWRRLMGQSPGLALLPGLLLLAHPAMLGVVLTGSGRLDLAALALLLLGAALMASESTGRVAGGLVLLILSVLAAPSGAPLSALAAFVLLERVPAMQKGAVLLLLCGTARALGAPSLLASGDWPGTEAFAAPAAPAAWMAGQPLSIEALLSTAAALIPGRPVVWLPGAEPPSVGLWLLILLAAGALLWFPERRFGGRWPALLALAALGLAVLSTRGGFAAAPGALAAPLILFGCWLSGLGDSVRRGRLRPALAGAGGLALVILLGVRTFHQAELFESQSAYFRAAAPADPARAERDGLALFALRAELSAAEPEEIRAIAAERLLDGPDGPGAADRSPVSSASVRVDRDLAVAAARCGGTGQALELIERAVRGAAEDPERQASILLDRVDLLLRAGSPEPALPIVEALLAEVLDAGARARILTRRGLIHAQLGLRLPAAGSESGGRERQLAEARRDFAAAITSDPDCARAHLDRGRLELALGEVVEAIKSLEAAARLRPDVAAPRLELAKLYFSRGQGEAGERELARASEVAAANDPDVVLVTAQLQLARGDLPGAVKNADRLSGRDHQLQGGAQSLAELYRILALFAEDSRNRGLAEQMARKSLRHGIDRDGGATGCLLRILRQERRFEEQVALLRQAERDGTPVENRQLELSRALKNAGYAHFVAKDRRGAFSRFLEACRVNPEFTDLGAIPGLLHSMAEQQDQEQVGQLADLARGAFERGLAAFAADDFGEARRLLSISIEMLPQNPFAHYHLGLIRDRLGELEAARLEYERALEYAEALDQQELAGRLRDLLGS